MAKIVNICIPKGADITQILGTTNKEAARKGKIATSFTQNCAETQWLAELVSIKTAASIT